MIYIINLNLECFIAAELHVPFSQLPCFYILATLISSFVIHKPSLSMCIVCRPRHIKPVR